MIYGGGRIIKVLNSCLIAEAAYSGTRSTVSALSMIIENTAEMLLNFVMMIMYKQFQLGSMIGLTCLYIGAIVLVSLMVYNHKNNSEELPE